MSKSSHVCSSCGAIFSKWLGRCPLCGEWNSVVEQLNKAKDTKNKTSLLPAVPIKEIKLVRDSARLCSQIPEFDEVLGGGIVRGSATILGGEPGIGKSTLVLQVLNSIAAQGHRCLLVSGEESSFQVRLRAERLKTIDVNLLFLSETSLPNILLAIEDEKVDLVVIDSIQSVTDDSNPSSFGSISQVKQCTAELVELAKSSNTAIIIIGHVTKEGSLAGPKTLEHLVDTVLNFEGDRYNSLRLLRSLKNRFGPTGQMGIFAMRQGGLQPVPNAGSIFLSDRNLDSPGSIIFSAVEGQRPFLVEVQALVTPSGGAPQRSSQGVDAKRLNIIIAILQSCLGIPLHSFDIFISVVGGVKILEPAADLALGLALVSAWSGIKLPSDLVVCAELGLRGELRQVGHEELRLKEILQMGFSQVLLPQNGTSKESSLQLERVSDLNSAVEFLGLEFKRNKRLRLV